MKKKSTGIILSILGVLSIVLITAGVTYAFFNYTGEGSTENSITTGSITFLYTENSGVGRGISLTDAFPISDEIGKQQVGEGNVFDFKVTSNTPNKTGIPYEITARKSSDSTLDESAVKLYLTRVNGLEEEVLLSKYSELTQTTKVDLAKYTEKTIYQGKVPANSTNYEQSFRLRMWIDEGVDFSQKEDGTYPYNGKTFTVTVNIYANAKIVTEEEMALENSTNLSSITVDGVEATVVSGQEYDYKIGVAEGTTSITINTETENPNATVTIEKIDSLAYSNTSSVKKLSTSKTFDLTEGVNYFKVTVTSENKEVTDEYKLKISVEKSLEGFAKIIYDANSLIEAEPTLTTSSNNTTDASGLYKSTATNSGNPTYYFRGNVENNYVSFAGFTWRVVRINEDGTIRMIMANGINNDAKIAFNSSCNDKTYMYYTNSNAKTELETWYTNNIASNENYLSKVAAGDYFCEQAKAAYSSSYASNSGASMTVYSSYTPDFKCSTDGNGKGLVNASVGLINYDELVFAGGYYNSSNKEYYLYNNTRYLTMSPAGFSSGFAYEWNVYPAGYVGTGIVISAISLRAVLNLKADTAVTGSGTSTDPWIVG